MTQHSKAPLILAAALGAAAVFTGTPATAGSNLTHDPDVRGPVSLAMKRADALERADDCATVRFDMTTRTMHVGRAEFGRAGMKALLRGTLGGAAAEREFAEKVHGPDDRILINDTTGQPWSTICKVRTTMPSGAQYMGSAVMVGPRHALTAGHVVYGIADGGFASSIEVIPGYDDGYAPFGRTQATYLHTFTAWAQSEDRDFDMALIELADPVGEQSGYLEMAAASTETLQSATLNTAGFPGDIAYGELMYYANGPTHSVDAEQIHYTGTMDTFGGQSGSGVWLKFQDGSRAVVGIHASGGPTLNNATRLTETKLAFIEDWMGAGTPPPPQGLAALSIGSVTSTLQGSVVPGASGTLTASLANDGGAAATVPVEVILFDHAAKEGWVLAEAEVQIDAGENRAVEIAFEVPEGPQDVTLKLYAWVNRGEDVPEDDYEDNIGAGPEITISDQSGPTVPSARTAFRGRNRFDLDGEEPVRFRIDVRNGAKNLKLVVKKRPAVAGVLTSPSGQAFTLQRKLKLRRPEPGEWTLEFRQNRGAVGTLSTWFKLKGK